MRGFAEQSKVIVMRTPPPLWSRCFRRWPTASPCSSWTDTTMGRWSRHTGSLRAGRPASSWSCSNRPRYRSACSSAGCCPYGPGSVTSGEKGGESVGKTDSVLHFSCCQNKKNDVSACLSVFSVLLTLCLSAPSSLDQSFPLKKKAACCSFTQTGGNSASVGDYFKRWINPHLLLYWILREGGRCMWESK